MRSSVRHAAPVKYISVWRTNLDSGYLQYLDPAMTGSARVLTPRTRQSPPSATAQKPTYFASMAPVEKPDDEPPHNIRKAIEAAVCHYQQALDLGNHELIALSGQVYFLRYKPRDIVAKEPLH